MLNERLDRQLRIKGWDQEILEKSRIAILGDDPLLTSLFILSSSAIGLNRLTAISPSLDMRIIDIARHLNRDLEITFLEGFFVHHAMNCFLRDCKVLVDLTSYGLANKLSVNMAHAYNLAVIRGALQKKGGFEELSVFTYFKGREWEELLNTLSPAQLPRQNSHDPVLSIILSGIVLEEVIRYLMQFAVSEELIKYGRPIPQKRDFNRRVCVVGAGALGNFVGLGLTLSGFRNITFIDPDKIELSNLNRQIFFYDSVGKKKAKILAERLTEMFEIDSGYDICYFDKKTEISGFDIIFDCVDNFETRIMISEKCSEEKKILISGGTSVTAGQVIVYHPSGSEQTPAEILGLYNIINTRQVENYKRTRESCVYRPEPSVVTTNQIIAGFMVDMCRRLLDRQKVQNLFYDSHNPLKIA